MSIIITIFFVISIYKILSESFKLKDSIQTPDVTYIEANNYTNILKCVYEDLDSYIGQTISFTGYVYRNSDFGANQFVLARDMKTSSENNKTLIVGFLCECKDFQKYSDGDWIKITGKIKKGNYHGEIPILEILEINEAEEPEDSIVTPPDNTYIPTAVIF